MTAVLVEITPGLAADDEIVFIDDVDALVESSKCSCNAGDDNPY
ncbi:hypothetical protein FDG2_4237 [Candidatus Protofrankia californiensis]|uniref:Uncharacterized protein n=1 Tax=Candidatus Protofrankia californiensis TaxID=1839754 RepID=A0A1C3P494_9ACTN|nr:hypothetical protein FDG2_4237 [Candidatus Protofrankia californiensis]